MTADTQLYGTDTIQLLEAGGLQGMKETNSQAGEAADVSDGDLFCRAEGDDMRDAGIRPGDYLVFVTDREPDNGDIVFLEIFGQTMCRRIFFEPGPGSLSGRIRIRREDGITPDLIMDERDVQIEGVFEGLLREVRRKKAYVYLSPGHAEQAEKREREKKRKKQARTAASRPSCQSKKKDPSMRVLDMGLPCRLANRLTEIGIRTAGDLLDIPDREAFLAIPGIGKKSYDQALGVLREYGFDICHLTW